MASASMRAHSDTIAFDNDMTKGFLKGGTKVVHFKGEALVGLLGNFWKIPHGDSYVFEEKEDDFSNHAKEAALMAASKNPKSVALLASGGPTVAINLSRFLLTCEAKRVFTIVAMHGSGGKSGAAGSFGVTEENLGEAITSLQELVPEFFIEYCSTKEISDKLLMRPLILIGSEDNSCPTTIEYILKPN